jgi:hypothetical protein
MDGYGLRPWYKTNNAPLPECARQSRQGICMEENVVAMHFFSTFPSALPFTVQGDR